MDRSLEIDELLADRGWLTRIARGLTFDADHADDAVQEAVTAALVTPPADERALGAWLGTVMRRGLARRRTSAGRREARERKVARPERLPSTLNTVERVELQRNVAEAVLELREPYRTTITLRYFEGLSTAEIAGREGVPDATVRTRIHRGLEHLRTRLDRSYGRRGAWHSSLVAVAGVGVGAGRGAVAGATSAGGTLALSAGTKVGVTVLVVAISIAGYFVLRGGDPPPVDRADVVASTFETPEVFRPDASSEVRDRFSADEEASASEIEAETVSSVREGEGARGPVVRGVVTGPAGDDGEEPVPVVGAEIVILNDEDEESTNRDRRIDIKTDEHGRFEARGLAPGRWRIHCSSAAHRWYGADLPIETWQREVVHDIQLEARILVRVHFETPQGERVAPMLRRAGLGSFGRLTVVATRQPPPAQLPATDRDDVDVLGVGRYHSKRIGSAVEVPEGCDGILELFKDEPVHVTAALRTAVLATAFLDSGQRDIVLVVPFARAMASLSSIRLRAVDADTGNPLPDATISIGNNNTITTGIEVEADGTYEQKAMGSGLWGVSVSCDGYEQVMHRMMLAPGETRDLGDVALERGIRLQGRLVRPDGSEFDGTFYFFALDSFDERVPVHLSGLYGTSDGGTFRLPALGSGSYALVLASHGQASQAFVFNPQLDEGRELVFEVAEGTPVRFDTRFGRDDVRVIHILDEQDVPVFSSNVRGGYGIQERLTLPPGRYRLIQPDGSGGLKRSGFLVEEGLDVELVLGES